MGLVVLIMLWCPAAFFACALHLVVLAIFAVFLALQFANLRISFCLRLFHDPAIPIYWYVWDFAVSWVSSVNHTLAFGGFEIVLVTAYFVCIPFVLNPTSNVCVTKLSLANTMLYYSWNINVPLKKSPKKFGGKKNPYGEKKKKKKNFNWVECLVWCSI